MTPHLTLHDAMDAYNRANGFTTTPIGQLNRAAGGAAISTTSLIGVRDPGGRIRFIESLIDGYPGWSGNMLRDHYSDQDQVDALLSLGTLAMLEETLGECWVSGESERDRQYGIEPVPTQTMDDGIEGFLDLAVSGGCAEWAYLFTGDGWLCANTRNIAPSRFETLDNVLASAEGQEITGGYFTFDEDRELRSRHLRMLKDAFDGRLPGRSSTNTGWT